MKSAGHPSTSAAPAPAAAPPIGSIVLISSIAAQSKSFLSPLYCAGKAALSSFVRTLSDLEAGVGIRVTAVAPGLVQTPLFTDDPAKLAWIDQDKDVWVTPSEVAEVMLECVQGDKWKGGMVVEVGSGQTRVVERLNDPGPQGKGFGVSGKGLVKEYMGIFGALKTPGWGLSK